MNHDQDLRYIHDMLAWALEVQEQAHGETRNSLEADRRLQLALMMTLVTTGEAASKTSRKFRILHSHIPWPQIIGMRNRLVHEYRDIVLEVIWNTVTVSIPLLISDLRRIIEDSQNEESSP